MLIEIVTVTSHEIVTSHVGSDNVPARAPGPTVTARVGPTAPAAACLRRELCLEARIAGSLTDQRGAGIQGVRDKARLCAGA